MEPSHTSGELELTTEVKTGWSRTKSSPNRISTILQESKARSGVDWTPMNGLSEYRM